MNNKRHYFIDGLRGLAIINMVAFHFLYDVNVVYGRDVHWPWRLGTHIWQQYICMSFILISGFVFSMGDNEANNSTEANPAKVKGLSRNLRRGIIINLYGLLITLVTVLFMPEESIYFGVLNLIGCSILLTCLFKKLFIRVPDKAGVIVSLILFLLFKHLPEGYIGIGSLRLGTYPEGLYISKLLAPVGLPGPGFASGDYFPIIPWFLLYICGYYLKGLISDTRAYKRICNIRIPVLTYIGTKSIWIYLLHQPICMLICMAIFE